MPCPLSDAVWLVLMREGRWVFSVRRQVLSPTMQLIPHHIGIWSPVSRSFTNSRKIKIMYFV